MFEHSNQPVISRRDFLARTLVFAAVALLVLLLSLALGVVGYKVTQPELTWTDALLNASMILGGMGPVGDPPQTEAGKLFASFYALFSGIVFLVAMSIFLAPALHRLLHHFHLQIDEESS